MYIGALKFAHSYFNVYVARICSVFDLTPKAGPAKEKPQVP